MTTIKFTPIAVAIGGVVAAVVTSIGGSPESAIFMAGVTSGLLISVYSSIRNRKRPQ